MNAVYLIDPAAIQGQDAGAIGIQIAAPREGLLQPGTRPLASLGDGIGCSIFVHVVRLQTGGDDLRHAGLGQGRHIIGG